MGGEKDALIDVEGGKIAYEAYCESANWRSKYTGNSLPPWEDADDDIKHHWSVAAKAVRVRTEDML